MSLLAQIETHVSYASQNFRSTIRCPLKRDIILLLYVGNVQLKAVPCFFCNVICNVLMVILAVLFTVYLFTTLE